MSKYSTQELAAMAAARPKLTLNWKGKTERLPDITFVDATPEAVQPPATPRMPRVIAVEPLDELSPLQICMNHWRDWMQQSDRDLGAKGQSGLAGDVQVDADGKRIGYDDGAAVAEAAAARASRDIAMATDAMIDSLPRHFKAAIYRINNIATVWRFPNLDFATVLPQAEQELIEKLSKNIATRACF
jgi:hypothetical protein